MIQVDDGHGCSIATGGIAGGDFVGRSFGRFGDWLYGRLGCGGVGFGVGYAPW